MNQSNSNQPKNTGTILIVEDNEDILELILMYMDDLGYTSIATTSALEAISILSDPLPIDLLFTDLRIPGDIDGLALAYKAKELRPQIKILLTTGLLEYLDGNEDFEVITKPYRQAELASRLEKIISSH